MRRMIGLLTPVVCLMLALLPVSFPNSSGPAYAADPTGPPPVNPPSPAPVTALPDLRGTWTGFGKIARVDGYRDVTITVKITEKGAYNLYRGWWTSTVSGQPANTMIFTGKFEADNRLHITQPLHPRSFQLQWQQTTNVAVFPGGWQSVLQGVGQMLDDKVNPDDSSTNFVFLKKTSP